MADSTSGVGSQAGLLQVGGLATGLDTNSIITGLISIEQQKVTREENAQSQIQLKLSTFNDLKTKLNDFDTQASAMDKSTVFNVFKNTSSDATVADITGGDKATVGNYDVKVMNLASSLKVASGSFANSNASLSLTGSFTISTSAAALKADPTATSVQIDITATDTITDIANKINRAKGTGATASVLKMGDTDYRLMLTAVDEGTKAFQLNAVAGKEAQSIFADGLDLVTQQTATTQKQALRANFDFRQAAGGPATAATTFASLFQSIGSASNLTNNDQINFTGTASDGTAINSSFTIANTAVQTVGDLVASIQAQFGAKATVSLNTSGEIEVLDAAGGVSTMALNLSLNDADSSGSKLGLGAAVTKSAFKNVVSQGSKAFYLMNDMSVSSQTNRDDNTVNGTVFILKRADPTQNIKLTLDFDKDGITKKVQDFLDSYNQLIKFIDDKSKINVTKSADPSNSQSQQTTTIDKGPFAGDSSILGLRSQIQGMMTSMMSELTDNHVSRFSSLASVGITSEQKTGFLTIKSDTFSAALDSDFEGVKRIFITGGYMTNSSHQFGTYTKDTRTGVYDIDPAGQRIDTDKSSGTNWSAATVSGDGDLLNSTSGDSNGMAVQAAAGSGPGKVVFVRGVAGQIRDFYDKITNFVDGFVTTTAKNYQDQINQEDTKIAQLESQVASVKDRLTQQFANLELSVSKLKSQSAAFSSSGLSR
ncbi:MAG: flagellar filament capping protein FliD [Fibrobacteres bacterium]|nr:flagellar filament capping protein FliD [Fibrobacterota bacterium]